MKCQLTFPGNTLSGTVMLPVSKSMSSRLLVINAIGNLGLDLTSVSDSKDTQTLWKLLSSKDHKLDVLDGGTTARFLIAYLAVTCRPAIVTGTSRMQKRPVLGLVEALSQLGAEITFLQDPGSLPIQIHPTPLRGNRVSMRGDISSQFISALLLVAPTLINGLAITLVGDIVSKPYIGMTLAMMRHYGITCGWNGNTIKVEPGSYAKNTPLLEKDWSAASYWYSMVALSPMAEITLLGLQAESLQGDSVVRNIFSNLGVETKFISTGCRITKSPTQIEPFAFDFSDCPDLAQTVITTCAAMGMPSSFSGLSTLAIKETNRLAALKQELAKLNVTIKGAGKGAVELLPGREALGTQLSFCTYNDHRMAMALSALCMRHSVTIDDPGVVAKSYPSFWREMEQAGIVIKPA